MFFRTLLLFSLDIHHGQDEDHDTRRRLLMPAWRGAFLHSAAHHNIRSFIVRSLRVASHAQTGKEFAEAHTMAELLETTGASSQQLLEKALTKHKIR